jgi:hypothetical protein
MFQLQANCQLVGYSARDDGQAAEEVLLSHHAQYHQVLNSQLIF